MVVALKLTELIRFAVEKPLIAINILCVVDY